LLKIPDFPKTAQDASDLLFIARSIKEEKRNLMLADKYGIRADNLLLGFLRKVPGFTFTEDDEEVPEFTFTEDDEEVPELFTFTEEDEEEIRQWSTEALEGLEQSKQEVLIAEQDIVFVCDLLREKGLPIDDKRPLLPDRGDGDKAKDLGDSDASDFGMDDSDEDLSRNVESLEL
jgi:hypothetical protein